MVHDVQYTRRESGFLARLFLFGVTEGFRSLYIPGVFGFCLMAVVFLPVNLLEQCGTSPTPSRPIYQRNKQQNTLSDPTSQPISSISHESAMTISQTSVPQLAQRLPIYRFDYFAWHLASLRCFSLSFACGSSFACLAILGTYPTASTGKMSFNSYSLVGILSGSAEPPRCLRYRMGVSAAQVDQTFCWLREEG